MRNSEDLQSSRKRKIEEDKNNQTNKKSRNFPPESRQYSQSLKRPNEGYQKSSEPNKREKIRHNKILYYFAKHLEAEKNKQAQLEMIVKFAEDFDRLPFNEIKLDSFTRKNLVDILHLLRNVLTNIYKSSNKSSEGLSCKKYLEKNQNIINDFIYNIFNKFYEYRDLGDENQKGGDWNRAIKEFIFIKKLGSGSISEREHKILEKLFIYISKNIKSHYPEEFYFALANFVRLIEINKRNIAKSLVTDFIDNVLISDECTRLLRLNRDKVDYFCSLLLDLGRLAEWGFLDCEKHDRLITPLVKELIKDPQIYLAEFFTDQPYVGSSAFKRKLNNERAAQNINMCRLIAGIGKLTYNQFLKGIQKHVADLIFHLLKDKQKLQDLFHNNDPLYIFQHSGEILQGVVDLKLSNFLSEVSQTVIFTLFVALMNNEVRFQESFELDNFETLGKHLTTFINSLFFIDKFYDLSDDIKNLITRFLIILLEKSGNINRILEDDEPRFRAKSYSGLLTRLVDMAKLGYLSHVSEVNINALVRLALAPKFLQKELSLQTGLEYQAKHVTIYLQNIADLVKLKYLKDTSLNHVNEIVAWFLRHQNFINLFKNDTLYNQGENFIGLLRTLADLIHQGFLKNITVKFINDLIGRLADIVRIKTFFETADENYQGLLFIKILTGTADLVSEYYLGNLNKTAIFDCILTFIKNIEKIKKIFINSDYTIRSIIQTTNALYKLASKHFLKNEKNQVGNLIMEFVRDSQGIKAILKRISEDNAREISLFFTALAGLASYGFLAAIPKKVIASIVVEMLQIPNLMESLEQNTIDHRSQSVGGLFKALGTFGKLGYLEELPEISMRNPIQELISNRILKIVLQHSSPYQAQHITHVVTGLAELGEIEYLKNISKESIETFLAEIISHPQKLRQAFNQGHANFQGLGVLRLVSSIIKLDKLGFLQNGAAKNQTELFSVLVVDQIQRLTTEKLDFKLYFYDLKNLLKLLQLLPESYTSEIYKKYNSNVTSLIINFFQEWQNHRLPIAPQSVLILVQGFYHCLAVNYSTNKPYMASEEIQQIVLRWIGYSTVPPKHLEEQTQFVLDLLPIFHRLTKIMQFPQELVQYRWIKFLSFFGGFSRLTEPQALSLFEIVCNSDFSHFKMINEYRISLFTKIVTHPLLFREDLEKIITGLKSLSVEFVDSLLNVDNLHELKQKALLISAMDFVEQFAVLRKPSLEPSIPVGDKLTIPQIDFQLPEPSEPTMLSLSETQDTIYVDPQPSKAKLYDIHNAKDIKELSLLLHIIYQQDFPNTNKSLPLAQFYIGPSAVLHGGFALYMKVFAASGTPAACYDASSAVRFGTYVGEKLREAEDAKMDGAYTFKTEKDSHYDGAVVRNHGAFINDGPPNITFFTNEDDYIEFTPNSEILAADNRYCQLRKEEIIQVFIDYGNSYFNRLKGIKRIYLDSTDNWQTPEDIYKKFGKDYKEFLMVIDTTTQTALGFPQTAAERLFLVTDLFAAVFNYDLTTATEILAKSPHQIDLQIFAAEKNAAQQYVSSYQIHQEHITPLMLACYLGYEPLIDLLISKGANVNRRSLFGGNTALFFLLIGLASEAAKLRVAKTLIIEHSAYVNLINSKEYNILHYCILNNNIALGQFLITEIKEGEWFAFLQDTDDLEEAEDFEDKENEQNNNSTYSQANNILTFSIAHGRLEIFEILLKTLCRNPKNRKTLREKIADRSLNLDEALLITPKNFLQSILETLWCDVKLHLDPLKYDDKINFEETIVGRFTQILEARKNLDPDIANICQWFAELTAPSKPKKFSPKNVIKECTQPSKSIYVKKLCFFGAEVEISPEDDESFLQTPNTLIKNLS